MTATLEQNLFYSGVQKKMRMAQQTFNVLELSPARFLKTNQKLQTKALGPIKSL